MYITNQIFSAVCNLTVIRYATKQGMPVEQECNETQYRQGRFLKIA